MVGGIPNAGKAATPLARPFWCLGKPLVEVSPVPTVMVALPLRMGTAKQLRYHSDASKNHQDHDPVRYPISKFDDVNSGSIIEMRRYALLPPKFRQGFPTKSRSAMLAG